MKTRLGFTLLLTSMLWTAPDSKDWSFHGGDPGQTKYSPLATINTSNVNRLELAWQWKTGERALTEFGTTPGSFETTPLMINDVLYVTTPYNRVVALDANRGEKIWEYDPKPYEYGQVPNGTGFVHRGAATWTDGRKRVIFMNSRWRLLAIDAETGKPVSSFGQNGEVDLTRDLLWPVNKINYTNTSPPVVYKDLVILANGVADRLVYKKDPPGDIQAFDVRTGRRVWRFNPIPQKGEVGAETWEDGSNEFVGHTNVWAPFTLDEKRGLLYLPFGTPSNDYYGGHRKGDNLFAETLVCLDANTGKRVWHFQTVHHGLWDYDLPGPPVLVTIRKDGRTIDAVAAAGKTGFVYVFDRVSGQPVWPIDERPVPASDVPGERAARTQPFPTKPAPFAKQGITEDDLNDFTPEIRQLALAEFRKYRTGPIFTPPTLGGTIMMPGNIGGANFGGASYDPETSTLYVKATNWPNLIRLVKPNPAESYADYVRGGSVTITIADGLPIHKPPYGALTAINMNTGEHLWQVPLGDAPNIRNHPMLKGVKLPEKLGAIGSSGSIVTKGGIVFIAGGDDHFHAIDKATGKTLWEYDLGMRNNATPMTYQTKSGRQFVVVASGAGENATLFAFALPR